MKEQRFYTATIIAVKEADGDKPRMLKYLYDGHKKPSAARWISVADPTVRYETTDENAEEHHKSAFQCSDGHVHDDLWLVEKLLEERGEGAAKEYLVRCTQPWTSDDDSWEPAQSIEDPTLISEFEAERDRERLEAEAEERRERARYVADTVERLRKKLRLKLESSKKAQPEMIIVRMEMGEEWKLLGLYEHALSLLLDGEDPANHLRAVEQYEGQSGRSKRMGFEFYILSHKLLERFMGTSHVRMQSNETAVGILPSVGFVRRGPRADMSDAKLELKAGFGALVGCGRQRPYWKFEGEHLQYRKGGENHLTEEARNHQRAIAQRLRATARRTRQTRCHSLCWRSASRAAVHESSYLSYVFS